MHERLARLRHGRGVSPIIAMILLVAIVVVLAAVLYVLVIGVVHGPGEVPLGTAFYAGPAGKLVGTSSSNAYCQTNHYCYSVPIDSAEQGLTISNVGFTVDTASGTPHVVTKNYARIALVSGVGTVLAYTEVSNKQAFVVTSWAKLSSGVTDQTPLTTELTIWVQFGATATSPYGTGLSLAALGQNGYSGVVSIALP
ncbi:MAG TPA: archaellin/type IV pilin N-terminal domain-containing protein [Thermoplasmata archaeon]|nr:archaellin/type IV pilin N-terminal domain-containing protein [Thermoplasmata archaeon]